MALVVRATDWSDTSRIVTLWSREFGRLRALAKGGRRLHSNFENALDLLSVCSIVLLRKSSGGLDLLTEARSIERFAHLRRDLPALYAGYYVAELLADWTEDDNPHPALFDEAVTALRELGGSATAVRLARFELVLLRELGYAPRWRACAGCGEERLTELAFSSSAGGMVCGRCQPKHRDHRPLSQQAWEMLRALEQAGDSWRQPWGPRPRAEVRHLLNDYVTYLSGRRPRLLPYLGS